MKCEMLLTGAAINRVVVRRSHYPCGFARERRYFDHGRNVTTKRKA